MCYFCSWIISFFLNNFFSEMGFQIYWLKAFFCYYLFNFVSGGVASLSLLIGSCQRRKLGSDVVVVYSLSRVWLFAAPWTAALQASLSLTISQSLPSSLKDIFKNLPKLPLCLLTQRQLNHPHFSIWNLFFLKKDFINSGNYFSASFGDNILTTIRLSTH